jgi:high-affinity nickel-transport protein
VLPLRSVVLLGFFLGLRHATDPDHVIAVTTIVARERTLTGAAATGVFWGLGHTLTILFVGGAIILFHLVIPVRLGLTMELAVSAMLVVLGILNLAGFRSSVPKVVAHPHRGAQLVHAHAPGDYLHTQLHAPLARLDSWFGRIGLYRNLRPLIVGIVHGLAGSAAVALLVLAAIPDSRWALAYLLVFGLGTIAGMMVITLSIASASRLVSRKQTRFAHRLAMASGLVSLAFGLFLAYQICFVQGLLTTRPEWLPR